MNDEKGGVKMAKCRDCRFCGFDGYCNVRLVKVNKNGSACPEFEGY